MMLIYQKLDICSPSLPWSANSQSSFLLPLPSPFPVLLCLSSTLMQSALWAGVILSLPQLSFSQTSWPDSSAVHQYKFFLWFLKAGINIMWYWGKQIPAFIDLELRTHTAPNKQDCPAQCWNMPNANNIHSTQFANLNILPGLVNTQKFSNIQNLSKFRHSLQKWWKECITGTQDEF